MNSIRELLTNICLTGAAVSFAAWAVLVNRRRIAYISEFVSRIPRSSLSVFLAFSIIATILAQKPDGTNAPPNGASPPQMMALPQQNFPPLSLLPEDGCVASVTSNDVARGFLLEGVVTNNSYSYAMPTNAARYSK